MFETTSIWSDIRKGTWVERLPHNAQPYARLMRLDRPIGTWLLLLPCWWGVAMASHGMPNLWLMLLFAIGAIIMRGAGCVVNDIYDRKLDGAVERTSIRPLPSGDVKLWQALLFLAVLLLVGLGILLCFNRLTVGVGALSLLLVFTYPLMKRITWWPQLFLGFTFNWGALLGGTATLDTLTLPFVLLYAAGIFWTLAYDTIYAFQDIRDDALIGIKSTARLFEKKPRLAVAAFYIAFFVLLVLAGWVAGLGAGYYAMLLITKLYVSWEMARWKVGDRENCLTRFKNNRNVGLLIVLAILVGKWF